MLDKKNSKENWKHLKVGNYFLSTYCHDIVVAILQQLLSYVDLKKTHSHLYTFCNHYLCYTTYEISNYLQLLTSRNNYNPVTNLPS
jgi:hypothetical protein